MYSIINCKFCLKKEYTQQGTKFSFIRGPERASENNKGREVRHRSGFKLCGGTTRAAAGFLAESAQTEAGDRQLKNILTQSTEASGRARRSPLRFPQQAPGSLRPPGGAPGPPALRGGGAAPSSAGAERPRSAAVPFVVGVSGEDSLKSLWGSRGCLWGCEEGSLPSARH